MRFIEKLIAVFLAFLGLFLFYSIAIKDASGQENQKDPIEKTELIQNCSNN